MKLESVSIKRSSALNEKWVQDQIAEDPSVLGLGDLVLRDRERPQQNAGALGSVASFQLVTEVEPTASLKYNKHYIGIEVDGSARNFVHFMPRKKHVIMTFNLPKTAETDELIEEAGFDTLPYLSRWRRYRLRLEGKIDEAQRQTLRELVKQARDGFGLGA